MTPDQKAHVIADLLDNNKASEIETINVAHLTSITDQLVIASALSERHVRALADKVVVAMKEQGMAPLSTDGASHSGWVIIDLDDVLVHIMLPETRALYRLEALWSITRDSDHTDE